MTFQPTQPVEPVENMAVVPGEFAPGAPDTRPQLWGHPRGLFLLFAVEMWERFSFYGMRAILGLYLKCKLTGMDPLPPGESPGFNPGRGWSHADANNLQGWYGGMAYLLPILGGLIADKIIGTHRSMLVGGVLIALGHVVLGISGISTLAQSDTGMSLFVTGLALIVIGTGHFKPSVSVMVNQLYPRGDPRQEGAFGIFYMGINLGALLGTFFVGWLGERVGWHYGFGLAAIGMVAGLLIYLWLRSKYLLGIGDGPVDRVKFAPIFLLTGVVLAAAVGYAFHTGFLGDVDAFFSSSWVFYTMLFGGIFAAVAFALSQRPGDRGPVATIFIYMLFNFIFWLAFEQAATSINFFTDELVDRRIGSGPDPTLVPTTWFQNINSFTIILLSPLFGILWTYIARKRIPFPQPIKIGLGLLWLAGGFVFMVIAGHQVAAGSGALASMWLLAATYFLHTVGELFLSPTGLAYVSKAAPKRHASLLMGVWFISSFLAYTVGGKLAGEADPKTIGSKHFFFQDWGIDMGGGYANFFFLFVFMAGVAGVLIILLTPLLRKLQRNPND
ncbi:peptide MFS transporter [soil metagenome]